MWKVSSAINVDFVVPTFKNYIGFNIPFTFFKYSKYWTAVSNYIRSSINWKILINIE